MYKAFYGLSRDPFEITPDPYFLVPTSRHNEALANLFYGVKRQKGFVVLTGEVGTGKTLLVRCLLELLRRQTQAAFAYVFNTALPPLEFLQYILGDFGLRTPTNKSEILLELNRFLLSRHQRGLITALVVDEGQLLSWNVLEEIRLLTNLETAQQKLLQIILVGQPELEGKLDSHELRQLKQRIALRCRLEPLAVQETKAYIQRRLQQAGACAQTQLIFPEATIISVHEHSGGIPRIINTLCENALITGFARKAHNIAPEIIAEVAADFRLNILPLDTATSGNGHKEDLHTVLKEFLRLAQLVEQAQESTRQLWSQSQPGAKT
jgi:general secretion pathway protein A